MATKIPHLRVSNLLGPGPKEPYEFVFNSDVLIGRSPHIMPDSIPLYGVNINVAQTFIQLENTSVSSNHAFVRPYRDIADVWDLNSKNGTRIIVKEHLGQRTNFATIREGDIIRIESYNIEFVMRECEPNYQRKHALLVAGRRTGESGEDLDTISRILRQRGFEGGDITALMGSRQLKSIYSRD